MDDQQKIPVRVVVKRPRGHGGSHGGAWKVAYADFVTAMMALFIVLWIVGQSSQMKQMIAEYFKDPAAFERKVRSGGFSRTPRRRVPARCRRSPPGKANRRR